MPFWRINSFYVLYICRTKITEKCELSKILFNTHILEKEKKKGERGEFIRNMHLIVDSILEGEAMTLVEFVFDWIIGNVIADIKNVGVRDISLCSIHTIRRQGNKMLNSL